MRTTIDLNDELFRALKRRAAQEGTTLRDLVEAAIRAHLGRAQPGKGAYRLRWRTEHGRMQQGVSLDDRDALFDLMEGRR